MNTHLTHLTDDDLDNVTGGGSNVQSTDRTGTSHRTYGWIRPDSIGNVQFNRPDRDPDSYPM